MNLRKKIFNLTDWVFKKSEIKNHLEDIKSHYFFFNDPANELKRQVRLKNMLDYAKENVPFYANIEATELNQFPVINKSTIKENYDGFISKQFDKNRLNYVTTSGSTGTPFKAYRDRGKIARHQADNIFFNSLVGGDIGLKLYYFRVWNRINRKNIFQKIIQNIVEVDANNFTEEYVHSFVNELENDRSKKFMLSYASSYEALSWMLKKEGITNVKSDVKAIISMSETLPDDVRAFLENTFHTKVISRYSNMENGFIGQQCLEHKQEYHLNTGSFLVETLSLDGDHAVEEGNIGRIVVTDYFNYGMPFIRYDTGDLGIQKSSYCNVKGPILATVEGRRTDFIYATSGQMLSPHIITNTMWKFPDVTQFQFIQKDKNKYLLKLNTKVRGDENNLQSEFKNFLGVDAEIHVEYVDEIPLLASGKRKKVVNEYKTL